MIEMFAKYASTVLRQLHPEKWIQRWNYGAMTTVSRQPSANYYTHGQQDSEDCKRVVVDFRSDTLTVPGAEMRQAMAEAAVGDAVFGEDPTVNELERRAAEMLGKEAALYVPSGTMSNLIAVMCHCNQRGQEMLLGDKSHIFFYEQGGAAYLAGVHPRTLTNRADGTFDLDEVEDKIRQDESDDHLPHTRLLCLENTHNKCGGRALPLSFMNEVRNLTRKYNVAVHLDGARVMNAAVALDVPATEITQYCDSISLCLSKGLGAPVGSLLASSQEVINRAKRFRKALGGGMRQVGILAAAGLMALDSGVKRLHIDHHNAKLLAQGIDGLNHPLLSVSVADTETNMVYLTVNDVTAETVVEMMNQVSESEVEVLGQGIQTKMFPASKHSIRMVVHQHITKEDVYLAVKKFEYVASQLLKSRAEASG
ncbi:uncharacterized protein LOC144435752 [Glandiceps talaboti]